MLLFILIILLIHPFIKIFNKINEKIAIKSGQFLFNTDRLATLYKCLRTLKCLFRKNRVSWRSLQGQNNYQIQKKSENIYAVIHRGKFCRECFTKNGFTVLGKSPSTWIIHPLKFIHIAWQKYLLQPSITFNFNLNLLQ